MLARQHMLTQADSVHAGSSSKDHTSGKTLAACTLYAHNKLSGVSTAE